MVRGQRGQLGDQVLPVAGRQLGVDAVCTAL